jgi:hypothetical protein
VQRGMSALCQQQISHARPFGGLYGEMQMALTKLGTTIMGLSSAIGEHLVDLQLKAKARQASKLAEIREALVASGYNTTAKQAAVLGVSRPTAWVVLNRDKRAGPSANVIKRILSSPNIPPGVRRKVEEYVEEKVSGLYGHSDVRMQAFRDKLHTRNANNAA